MLINKGFSEAWNAYGTAFLEIVFPAVLIGRFLFPFFYNPVDYLFSDMLRHVRNAYYLLHPDFLNAMDPKAYQVWIYLLQLIPQHEYRFFSALSNGLLCAGMTWFWYKALREITTRNKALILGIVLGVHLAFLLTVYSYFLMETLLLTSVALAVWMTLRAVRKRTLAAFVVSTLCWLLAAFTKQTALPIALMGMGYSLTFQPNKARAFAVASVLFIACVIPAGWQGMKAVNVFAPFGLTDIQVIARKSERTGFGFRVDTGPNRGLWGLWYPEAFYVNPLAPFATFVSPRSTGVYIANVNLTEGQAGWDEAVAKVERNHTWRDVLNDYEENVIFLFFAYDDIWPDAEFEYPRFLMHLNASLRWLWFPCFLLVIFYGPFARMSPDKTWILLVAFAMTWMFLLQDVAIVEGRYRKIIEPFLIVSVFFMIESLLMPAQPGRTSLRSFVLQTYIYPLLRQLLGPVFPTQERADQQRH